MQILGCIEDARKTFNFQVGSDNKSLANKNNFIFSDKKIFIYIDGVISKYSSKISGLTADHSSINQKIAYLYSIGFNFEKHIFGSFNIFLFDYSNKELKIIRDSRGTRSIYYAKDGKDFIFSTDQKLIINLIKNVTLNHIKLMHFLDMNYVSNKFTYLNEIFRIQPRNCLIYKNNSLKTYEYTFSKILFGADHSGDIESNFKRYFYQSVTSLAKKGKKIGVLMSGGLDSSAITIALKENQYTEVYTYSNNFHHVDDDKYIHESKYQKNISKLTSYLHTSIQMEGKSPIIPIKKFTRLLNEPINIPNIYLFEEIANKMNGDGVDIILDGNDGDSTVSHGFEVLFFYLTNFKLIKFTKEVYLYSKFKKTSFLRLMLVLLRQAAKEIFNIRENISRYSILKKDISLNQKVKENITYFSSHEQIISNDIHFLSNEFRNNFFRYFGIENFSPFYDEELIYFCINMPFKNKLHNGYTRKILRDFLSEYLPEDHVNRDKSILTYGLLKNFTISDLQIVKNEFSNINQTLLNYIDIPLLKTIISNLEDGNKITEEEIIRLQVFTSANTFLNDYKF